MEEDKKVVKATVYDKSMTVLRIIEHGYSYGYNIAYVILFKDFDDNLYQYLKFDDPVDYSKCRIDNVCKLIIRGYPKNRYPILKIVHRWEPEYDSLKEDW